MSSNAVVIDKKERINGWSWPLHPFQLVAWFFVVAIPFVYYGSIVSHLPKKWILVGCLVPGACLLVHIIFHVVCLTIDPADPKIRQELVEKAEGFDRSLHKHVIENCHCYICQVDVGKKSKHCALCNKCISEFDHHCKWLNNCIGGRNYKLFLSCLSAALATALSFLVFCLYLFVMYFKNKASVIDNIESWSMFGDLSGEIFITLTAIIIVLLLLAILLLGHLLCFHIFLIRKGLSTYDFIVQNRQAAVESEESENAVRSPNKLKTCKANKVSQQNITKPEGSGIEVKMKNLQEECQIEINHKPG